MANNKKGACYGSDMGYDEDTGCDEDAEGADCRWVNAVSTENFPYDSSYDPTLTFGNLGGYSSYGNDFGDPSAVTAKVSCNPSI
jgi:hypothetical protein